VALLRAEPMVCPILVGREPHLELLDRLVEQTRGGQGQTVLLSGEAGVGKSRLLAEVRARAASHGFLPLKGHAFEQDVTFPYAPLIDMLRSFFAQRPATEALGPLGPLARAFTKLLPELEPVFADVKPLAALEVEAEKRRLFEALVQLLTQLAGRQPLLVILEDLHWADETSLEWLHLFARRLVVSPILLLASYRREEVSPALHHLLAQLDRERLAYEVGLKPLTPGEVDTMLRAIFQLARPVRTDFLDALYALSEGNPFFIEEVLKSLLAAGDIFFRGGKWDRKPLQELQIPRSVRDAVARRVGRLSPAAHEVLCLAAVTGRRFDFALLQTLTRHSEAELLEIVKELIAAQLVVEASAERFAFRHALTREAIYLSLLARQRKDFHRVVAEAQERLHGLSDEPYLAELADHFFAAEVWEKALDYAARAGHRAQALYAPRAAVLHFSRAVEAAQRLLRAPSADLYRARGQAYETLGEFERARADLEAALKLAEAAGDARAEWQTLLDLGKLWAARDYGETGAFFGRALTLARTMNDPATLAASLNRLGNWRVNTGAVAEGLAAHHEALTLFEARGAQEGVAETLDLLGMGSGLYGDMPGAVRYLDRAVPLFRSLDLRRGLASSLIARAVWRSPWFTETTFGAIGSLETCVQDLEEARTLARQIGWLAGEAFAEFAAAEVCGAFGELGRALEHAERALGLAAEIGHAQWMTGASCIQGECYLLALEPQQARQSLETALALAQQVGSALWTGATTVFLARTYLLEHDLARTEELLTAALPKAAPRNVQERQLLWSWGDLALARGKPDLALQIAEDLLASVPGGPTEQPIPALLKLKGEALMALGRLGEAEEALEAARRGALQRQVRPLLWQIYGALARLYRRRNQDAAARRALSDARGVIAALAETIAEPGLRARFLRAARALLSRGTADLRRGGLTAREWDVAKLLAEGRSNREIARSLSIGERTVETHVGNILNRLGFNSRVQVAAWLAARDREGVKGNRA